jgi:hypothetical protein
MLGKGNPIQESQIEERIGRAADSFWSAFQMMENGRVKSTLMLYSFCLCWVFAAVYGAAIALLIGPLHMLMAGSPVFLENLVTALVPAVLGTAVCCLTWLLPGDKRKLPAAYLWLTLLMLACLIALLILLKGEQGAQILALQFFGMFVLIPLIMGDGMSILLFYRYWKHKPPVKDVAELRKGP